MSDCCEICGALLEWKDCWKCYDPDSLLLPDCPECDGEGGYWQCSELSHSEEDLAAWRKELARRDDQ